METVTPSRIAGIRFQELGKLYHFEAGGIPDLKVGDQVLVSTSRGRELGEVAGVVEKPPAPPEGGWEGRGAPGYGAGAGGAAAVAARRARSDDRMPRQGVRIGDAARQDRQGRVLLRWGAPGLPVHRGRG